MADRLHYWNCGERNWCNYTGVNFNQMRRYERLNTWSPVLRDPCSGIISNKSLFDTILWCYLPSVTHFNIICQVLFLIYSWEQLNTWKFSAIFKCSSRHYFLNFSELVRVLLTLYPCLSWSCNLVTISMGRGTRWIKNSHLHCCVSAGSVFICSVHSSFNRCVGSKLMFSFFSTMEFIWNNVWSFFPTLSCSLWCLVHHFTLKLQQRRMPLTFTLPLPSVIYIIFSCLWFVLHSAVKSGESVLFSVIIWWGIVFQQQFPPLILLSACRRKDYSHFKGVRWVRAPAVVRYII